MAPDAPAEAPAETKKPAEEEKAPKTGILLTSPVGIGILSAVVLVVAGATATITMMFAGKRPETVGTQIIKGKMNETLLIDGIKSIKEEIIAGRRKRHVVQMDLVIEVDDGPGGDRTRNKARLDTQKPRFQSEIIRLLDEWAYSDIKSQQFMNKFQSQLKQRFNVLFGNKSVKSVLITNLQR